MFELHQRHGFTLIEIMIVVAIIFLLLIVAIPNFMRLKHDTNEKGAIAALQTIATALESFRYHKMPPSYPLDMKEMALAAPPYIDINVVNADRAEKAMKGYYYNYARITVDKFICSGQPAIKGTTGTRIFFVDETGIIRLNNASGEPVE